MLPAERGDILDRNGEPLADSVDGLMVVADPAMTADQAPELARFLAAAARRRLHHDPAAAPRARAAGSSTSPAGCPSTRRDRGRRGGDEAGFEGLGTRRDPVRDYPAGDVAANLVGFLGTDEALGGLERTFDEQLAGTDGSARYEVGGGNRIPLGENTVVDPVDGADLHTTIDRDLQWYTQRVLRQTVEDARGGLRLRRGHGHPTGELLALADYPTFDANDPRRARQGRPRLARAERRLRARLGREGAHASAR